MKFPVIARFLRTLADLRLTALVLLIFFILTLAGTLLQVRDGLWVARQTIFQAWIWWIPLGDYGWFPFPGVLLAGTLAVLNLSAALIFRLRWNARQSGLILTHLGLLGLLISGALGLFFSEHYVMELAPGIPRQNAESPEQWDLGLRVEDDSGASWYLYPLPPRAIPANIDLGPLLPNAKILGYLPNGSIAPGPALIPDNTTADPERWTPALILAIGDSANYTLVLGPTRPAHALSPQLSLGLRKRTTTLPFVLTLIRFEREHYEGTEIARRYESHLELKYEGQTRRAQIRMNQPLRLGNYTIFQSSYRENPVTGMHHSILSVVHNPWRMTPYYATLLIALGLILHLGLRLFKPRALPLVILSLLSLFATPAQALIRELPEHLRQLPVLSDGRVKPLETNAVHFLLSLSGRAKTEVMDSIPALDAASWWFNTLLDPQSTENIPVFLIENPEIRDALELTGKERDRYSWKQISPAGARLDSLANWAQFIPATQRDAFQREILRLNALWHRYAALTDALKFLRPHSVAPRPDSGLPHTFLQLARRSSDYALRIDSLLNHPGAARSPSDSAFLEWLETTLDSAEIWARAPVYLYPSPSLHSEISWNTLGQVLLREGLQSPAFSALIQIWDSLYTLRNSPDNARLNALSARLLAQIQNAAGTGLNNARLDAELAIHRLNPFGKAMFLFLAAIALALCEIKNKAPWISHLATWLIWFALTLTATGMALRSYITERPPVTNLYETLVFVAFVSSLSLLLARRLLSRSSLPAALSGALLLWLAQKHGSNGDTMPVLVAVLDSNFWLMTHVLTITLGYGGIVASGLAAHLHLWLGVNTPSGKNAFRAVRWLQGFGLLFTFVGTLLGGIWADQSWGRFWGWDPKENGALLIVLWSAFLFHGPPARLFGARGFSLGAIAGISVVLFAWFGVNLLGVGLHSYGFTEGTFYGLLIYGIIQILLVAWLIFSNRASPDPG